MAAGHFLPNVGGVERYIYNLSRALIRQGCEVSVLTTQSEDAPLIETMDGIDVFRLPSLHLGGGRLPVPKLFNKQVLAQLAAVEAWQPDIFVIHTHLFLSNLCAARLARRTQTPQVLVNHGSGFVKGGNFAINLALQGYEHLLARQIGRHSAEAFGVSQSAAKWLSEFGIDTGQVIANGVDIASMPKRSAEFRHRLGLSDDACMIAFAARLLPEKGADTLIAAFKKLNPADAGLVIAGDGPAMGALKGLSDGDSRITFLGACRHSDVLQMFGSADIMAYPSRYPEGQPTTVLEAGAMGCAVIASPRGGTAELIDNPDLGIITDCQSDLELALNKLINDAAYRKHLGTNLQRKVHTLHDWRIIAERAAATFSRIVTKHKETVLSQ
ncbi:hypothetical protein BBF93_03530 [Hyphomonas sp. CACIAM 19H1]|uniref:glycosyltransferase family 4 protein n=1 Tax=Hyphomonas sp. CACIAM 19H1 TaxID=1873716 RepID=UPI000DED5476|nr:glycosyltransferase family 4 protein [Hyphomonas sp. CACIAM 19H1]AXE63390.1 hypothetical protein BBF93_03530 [Hyphomonas sp. CACIAM 19H1]